MPEISVIIPVYNVEKYLCSCVESVLNQTFADFELILVDDGSTDSGGEACDVFAARDPRVHVIHQQNAGQSAARNRGVREAKTGLICFIDADDAVNPTLLENLVRLLRETGAGAAVSPRIQGETPPPGFFEPVSAGATVFHANEQNLLNLFRENDYLYWTLFPCLMYRRIYEKYPLAEGRGMEDNAVSCKWLTEAGSVARADVPMYFYRINPTGTMQGPFSEKKLDYLWALEEQLAFFEAQGFSQLQNAVAAHYAETAVWFSSRVKNELKNPRLARSVLRKARQIRDRYAADGRLSPELERKLFKAGHPFLHRIRKRIVRN